ncbi:MULTISPECIES: hypothetical protein [unclassified Streptomyces]|uniref:hypothetical protein n=1 Tax=unclassified Streptomyces TaxID=2593676 RepID=UPI003421CD28
MAAKRMVEYSVSVPADSKTSFSVNHTPGGTTCVIELGDARCDVTSRQYDVDDEIPRPAEHGQLAPDSSAS